MLQYKRYAAWYLYSALRSELMSIFGNLHYWNGNIPRLQLLFEIQMKITRPKQ